MTNANATWETLCDSCTSKSCCKGFAGANLLPKEVEKITKATRDNDFTKTVLFNNVPTFVIKKKENSDECKFWDDENQRCSIYESRPFDCKLFPFDIHDINGEFMWVINTCNPDSDWSWAESMLESFESDPSFAELVENLDSYSYPESTKNKLYEIKILRPIKYSRKNKPIIQK